MSVAAVGRRRQEGGEKVTGATRFTADLELAGLLHVHLVLSHAPSARIRRIETGAARAVPGVVDVVMGADLPGVERAGPDLPLAVDRVFYAGQPVVAVIAESESAATDAAALVEVEYEETQPVVDPIAAMGAQAPLVLGEAEAPDAEDASLHGASAAADGAPDERPRNVTGVAHLKRGDTDAALKAADVVVKGTYRIAGAHQSFMEPHVAVVRPEPDGGLTVWSSTQGPFVVRDTVAGLLDLPPHKVRVVGMPVGGGFGGKIELLEPLLALLAVRLHRPVRLALGRSHEFVVGRPAPAAQFDLELGAKRDGTLVALRARFHYDNGASAGWHAGLTANFLGGTYRVPNFDLRGFEVSTNKTPTDAYRAPGATQAYFALETAMDELAVRLEMDPIELKLRNVSREGDPTADGGDTASAPFSTTSSGSQVTYSVGGAVYEAAREARRQLLEIATEELEAAPEDLEIVGGRVAVKGAPSRSVEITKLVRMSREFMGRHKPIEATGRSAVQAASPMFTLHIARVRIDRETGAFQLSGYAAIQDVGHAINPPEVEGQIHGGATQALGRALGEQLVYDGDGQLRTASFLDYELPAADQVPDIDVRLIEIPSPVGPLGAKGVGEPPAIPGTAALANAVSRASGVRVHDVPIDRWSLVRTPEDGR